MQSQKASMSSLIKIFRIAALLEGISYLALFSNMLFVKPNFPSAYKSILYPLGMTHGVLFMAYIILAIVVGSKLKWNLKTMVVVLLGSIIPFGTFYVDYNYLKDKI